MTVFIQRDTTCEKNTYNILKISYKSGESIKSYVYFGLDFEDHEIQKPYNEHRATTKFDENTQRLAQIGLVSAARMKLALLRKV